MLKITPTKRIRIQDADIEYYESPNLEKDIILLIHGWNCSINNYYYNIPYLSKHFSILAPNLPGNSNSSKWNKTYTPENYAIFLKEFIDTIKINNYKINIVGHSMGARIGLFYANKFPESVNKLVLIDPVFTEELNKNKSNKIIEIIKKNRNSELLHFIIKIFKNNPITPRIWSYLLISHAFSKNYDSTKITVKGMIESTPETFIDGLCDMFDNSTNNNLLLTQTNKNKISTYYIFGENDPVAKPTQNIKKLNNKELFIIKNTRHTPNREKPKDFNELLYKIIKE